jgi:hypothetical protein
MPRQPKRLYVPLDVAFFDDDKIEQAGEKAAYLYLAMLAKAKTIDRDGVLTKGQITRLGIPGTPARLKALLDAELVFELPMQRDVYAIGAWHRWNESAEDRARRLKEDRERKAREAAERAKSNQ